MNVHENPCSDKGAPYNPQQVQGRIREILGKYSNGFWVSKLPQIYRELYKQELPSETIKDLETWTHICTVRTRRGQCVQLKSLILFMYREKKGPLAVRCTTIPFCPYFLFLTSGIACSIIVKMKVWYLAGYVIPNIAKLPCMITKVPL